MAQGTKIIVELKDEDKDFSDDLKLESMAASLLYLNQTKAMFV